MTPVGIRRPLLRRLEIVHRGFGHVLPFYFRFLIWSCWTSNRYTS